MKLKAILLAAMLGVASAGTALATTEQFQVDLVIRQPIVITEVDYLFFGEVDQGAQTVTVDAAATPGPAAGFNAHAASFTVEGQPSGSANVSVDATVDLGLSNLVSLNVTPATVSFDGGGTGTATIYVGGSVDLTAGDGPGTYSGTATLTVVYP